MNCPHCKHQIPDGANFCLECGAHISRASAQSHQEGSEHTSSYPAGGAPPGDVSIDGQRTMEYVDGGTLRQYAKQHGGALPVATAVELIKGIALTRIHKS